ncbi:hypothetical protein D3C87_2128230 [compost metagenome]
MHRQEAKSFPYVLGDLRLHAHFPATAAHCHKAAFGDAPLARVLGMDLQERLGDMFV